MGIIMDFEGLAIDSLRDLVLLVREVTLASDERRAIALRDAYMRVDPQNAADNLVYAADWAFKDDNDRTRQAMHLMGVTRTVYGGQAPADVLKPVWKGAVEEEPPNTLADAIEKGVLDADQYAAEVVGPAITPEPVPEPTEDEAP